MKAYPELAVKLRRSGLELLGFVETGGLPSPISAWSIFASSEPTMVFSDPGGEEFTRYDDLSVAWLSAARTSCVVQTDNEFLISVEGGTPGTPWARVRLTDALSVEGLGHYPKHPSFVAMDLAGTRLCGVDTEEHGFWIIVSPASRTQ
jgi:hypothetical protein